MKDGAYVRSPQEARRIVLLNRILNPFGAILLTVSAITPASSVFIIVPGVIAQAGTGAVSSLILAAAVGLIMAVTYSELASAFPHAGGEYVIVQEILGRLPAFVTLVLNGTVMVMISSVLALGAGDYAARLFPVPPQVSAILMILVATLTGIPIFGSTHGLPESSC